MGVEKFLLQLICNVQIDDKYEALIMPGEENVFRIKSTITGGGYNDFLTVTACDVIGNKYVWKYQLQEIDGIRKENGDEMNRHYYRIVSEEREQEEIDCLRITL